MSTAAVKDLAKEGNLDIDNFGPDSEYDPEEVFDQPEVGVMRTYGPTRAARRYLPSRSQTAVVWTRRSWASSLPVGAGMFRVVVTAREPSAVAAANWV
jgi:hypothetical protein